MIDASDPQWRASSRRIRVPRLGEGRLANARLPADEHEAAIPSERGVEMLPQHTEFALSPDEQRGRGTRQDGAVGAHGGTSCVGRRMMPPV